MSMSGELGTLISFEASCSFRPCFLVPVTVTISRALARRDSRYTH